MKPLYQRLAEHRRQIAADEALVAADEHLHTTHQAKERLPRLRDELAKLTTDLELAEAAWIQQTHALSNLRTITHGDRELSLAITHAEDALHRIGLHLGKAEN